MVAMASFCNGFSRASEFDPSRWMPGGDATPHMENDSFWPYGGGPRNCIGMGFAMMEVSLVSTIVPCSNTTSVIMQSCSLLEGIIDECCCFSRNFHKVTLCHSKSGMLIYENMRQLGLFYVMCERKIYSSHTE